MRRIWLPNVRKYVIIDDEDYSEVSQYKLSGRGRGRIYCMANVKKNGKWTKVSLAQIIMRSRRMVFFKDGNPLNCRKSNLLFYSQDVTGKMTDELKSVILGTLLGDSSVQHSKDKSGKRRFLLQCQHGEDQKDYLFHKAELLSSYVKAKPKRIRNAGYGGPENHCWRFHTGRVSDFDFLDMCYDKNDKKYVSQEWVDNLTLVSLAYWYMDDGTINSGRYVSFCTYGFSVPECNRLVKKLRDMGFAAKVTIIRRPRPNNRKYPLIIMDSPSSKRFLEQVGHLIVDCLKYKTHITYPVAGECSFCGDEVPGRGNCNWRSCSKEECKTLHKNALSRKYVADHRQHLNACKRRWYAKKQKEKKAG